MFGLHTGVVAGLVTFGFGDFVRVLALVEGGGAVVVGVGVAGWGRGRLGRAATLACSYTTICIEFKICRRIITIFSNTKSSRISRMFWEHEVPILIIHKYVLLSDSIRLDVFLNS